MKPSEITPLPMTYVAETLQRETKLPPGVLNLVHGSKQTTEALISHPLVRGVTFVGSTPVGKYVYKLAGEYGKRAIVQAGAKNTIVVMPDADLTHAIESCNSSFFGNTGQRCLAGANLVTTPPIHDSLLKKFVDSAEKIRLGYGLDESTEMGPMISARSKERVLKYIDIGASEGATLTLDGRKARVPGYENGFFIGASIFDDVSKDMKIAKEKYSAPSQASWKLRTSTRRYGGSTLILNLETQQVFSPRDGSNAREFQEKG